MGRKFNIEEEYNSYARLPKAKIAKLSKYARLPKKEGLELVIYNIQPL